MLARYRCALLLVAALGVAGAALADDCGWRWVNPTPPRVDILRLKQEVNSFVGVGAAGTILRSSDGFGWEVVASGVDGDLYGVDWGAGAFVAVGDGAIVRSTNARDWTTVVVDPAAVFVDVEFSVSRFVAVGRGLGANVLTSVSGVDWEPVPVPWGTGADSIAGSNQGFFVAVGTQIWFSSNGFDWEYQGPVPATTAFTIDRVQPKRIGSDLFELDRIDLAWTGSRLLWAGGAELWSRDDQEEWELVQALDGCASWRDWLGLAAGPGWAMASGISGCPSPYLDPTVSLTISTDGGTTFGDPWETELGGFPGLARYGSRWVAAGALGDVMTSADGAGWDCPGGGCTSLACADEFVDLAASDDRWLAVGGVGLCDGNLKRRAGRTVASSSDGRSWAVEASTGDRFRGVTYTGTEFLAVGDGWLARSANGVQWATESPPDGAVLHAVGSGDGWVVAVGQGGDLFVSDDGHSWFKPFLYVTADLDRVVWDGEMFLALGGSGTILTSTDAMNWETALTASAVDLRGAAAGDGVRIAVGDDGVVLGSTDGEVWTPRRSGVGAALRDVAWDQDRFVAVGYEQHADGSRPAVVLASADGGRWTRFPAAGEALQRIRWTGERWLAVGGERTIVTAGCLGTMIAADDERLRVPHGGTVDLLVRLSDEVDVDTPLSVVSSAPGRAAAPPVVTVPAGTEVAYVPVSGLEVVADAVLTLSLPAELGGGSTTVLVDVLPPVGRPRTPSGRVSP